MDAAIYEFSNGVRLYLDEIRPVQIARYTSVGNPNLHEPVEERWFVQLLNEAGPNPIFLDLGSAIGYYSILAAKIRSDVSVHAVEPLALHRDALKRNLALNDISGAVTIHDRPIHSSSGTIQFREANFGSKIVKPDDLPSPHPCVVLEAMSIAELIATIGRVDVLKMDIQGTEAIVIESFLSSCDPSLIVTWVVGTHGPKVHAEVVAHLSQAYDILHEDLTPLHQPDGLVVARRRNSN